MPNRCELGILAAKGVATNLVGVRGGWVRQCQARHVPGPVRAGHDTGGAVVGGEVVQQPDRVADLVRAGLDGPAPVGMQVLMALAGQRGPEVQRGELKVAQHVVHAGQQPGIGEAGPEHPALVDQVGQPVGAGLLMDFEPGLVALDGQQFGQPGPDRL